MRRRPGGAGVMGALGLFVRIVEAVNYRVGRIAMWGFFAMMAVLLWSSISKTFFNPSLWTLETAQFLMVSYFFLGGAYAIQMGSNVRMDLFYADWSERRKAAVDVCTVFFLLFFLAVLLRGGVDSLIYSLTYGERNPTAWRPLLWPVKAAICLGIVLMILQSLAELARDAARLRGVDLGPRPFEKAR